MTSRSAKGLPPSNGQEEWNILNRSTSPLLCLEIAKNKVKLIRYLLDGAHNIDGVRNLAKTLGANFKYGKLVGVWGDHGR